MVVDGEVYDFFVADTVGNRPTIPVPESGLKTMQEVISLTCGEIELYASFNGGMLLWDTRKKEWT